jgi:AcrR family transcriptional regulator
MTPDTSVSLTPAGTSPAPPTGRPRDEAREQAILDATLALVAEVGYERLTMDAIATRAKASKATIYRRWAGKVDLVVAAMHCYVGDTPDEPDDTGSLRGDLAALCRQMTDKINGFDGHLILGLSQAALSNPDLCRALEEQTSPSKARRPRIIVERAIARGEIPTAANHLLFNEIAPAIVIMRLINGQPIDDAYLTHLVDDILIPALSNPSTDPSQLPAETTVPTPLRSSES